MADEDHKPQTSDEIAKELEELAKSDDVELTENTLQAKLNQYHAALSSEFEIAAQQAETDDDTDELLSDFFRKHIPTAAAQLVFLAFNSTSDSVRLTATKEIIRLAQKEDGDSGDPIKQLLKDLSKGKPTPTE